jgi:hypothetical protein
MRFQLRVPEHPTALPVCTLTDLSCPDICYTAFCGLQVKPNSPQAVQLAYSCLDSLQCIHRAGFTLGNASVEWAMVSGGRVWLGGTAGATPLRLGGTGAQLLVAGSPAQDFLPDLLRQLQVPDTYKVPTPLM